MIVEWFVDSNCTKHMTSNRDDFIEYNKLFTQKKMFITNDHAISVIVKKTVQFTKLLLNDIEISITFFEILHVSKLSANLFSTIHFIKNDEFVIFDQKKCTMYHKKSNKIVLHSFKNKNQYSFNLIKQKTHYVVYSTVLYSNFKYNEKAIQLWYRRTKHLNRSNFIRLQNMIDDVDFINKSKSIFQCENCNTEKLKLKFSRRFQNSIYEKNAMFDSNLNDFINSFTWNDMKYYCLKKNKITKLLFLYLYVIKNEFFTHLKNDFIFMFKI